MLKTTGKMTDFGYETPLPPLLPGQDDRSVDTHHVTNSPTGIAPVAVEIFVKIEFCAKDNNKDNNIPVMKLHRDLLLAIWNVYTPGVVLNDKNNNFVNGYSLGKIKSINDYQKLFSIPSTA